ncbi:zinc finger MYM-type protein 1-like [Aphis gossypii]|uniref:zinc finger MYM-type protein 1-like n=1 Tax=Aphis gossypii TaxID=80765 RepID=UPI00215907DD|nr:zinc finger MYM-type protein 1-like [Aphis gossypii]
MEPSKKKRTLHSYFSKQNNAVSTNVSIKEKYLDDPIPCIESDDCVGIKKTDQSQIFCSVADTKDIELSNLPKFGLTNLNLVKSSTPNQTITDPADPVYPISSNRYEKMERIKKDPFQPHAIIFPRRKLGASEINFHDNWYSQFNWLEYSPCLDAAFCFPCRCFASEISSKRGHADKAYTKTGFRGWNIATTKFKAHQITSIHISSVNILSEYLKANPIDGILVKEKQLEISRQEEQRIANRTIMKRLIDIIITLTKGGRASRGHNEKNDSFEKGLFLEIVHLLSRYDPVIKNHLENGARNTTYISNRIQNGMLNSIENIMLLLIISNVQSKPVSIISDDTTDMGHHEQMSIVVRYFDDDTFNPVERFVGLQRLKLVDSQSIFNELSMVLKNLKIQWRDVVSVCFDGASTMSGCISGVQAKCKEVNSSIMYVHCYAHCLNLILVDACTSRKENRIVFDFFGVVQLTYSFIEGSAIRHAVLERISADINASLKSMKSSSTTRWACRSEAVSALKHNYSAILLALEEIVDRAKQPDVRA